MYVYCIYQVNELGPNGYESHEHVVLQKGPLNGVCMYLRPHNGEGRKERRAGALLSSTQFSPSGWVCRWMVSSCFPLARLGPTSNLLPSIEHPGPRQCLVYIHSRRPHSLHSMGSKLVKCSRIGSSRQTIIMEILAFESGVCGSAEQDDD